MRNPNLKPEDQRSLERRQKIRAYAANHVLFRLILREPFAAVCLSALMIWAPLAMAELALWRGAMYPESFITDAPSETLHELRQACGAPLEVKRIDSSIALTRCGLFWPVVSVWRVPRSIVDPTMK